MQQQIIPVFFHLRSTLLWKIQNFVVKTKQLLVKKHQFDVSPGKPSSRLFSSKKVEANRQALYERCECELVHELTQSRLQIS